jgi:hypothetical protein
MAKLLCSFVDVFSPTASNEFALQFIASIMEIPSCETDSSSGDQKFPTFYGTPKFIAVLTRAYHWIISKATPYLTS